MKPQNLKELEREIDKMNLEILLSLGQITPAQAMAHIKETYAEEMNRFQLSLKLAGILHQLDKAPIGRAS